MRTPLLLCGLCLLAGCYQQDIRSTPEYQMAQMRADLADSQSRMLSEGLAFYKAGVSLAEAEAAYRDCLVQAQMATAAIPSVITRRLREHELVVNAMRTKGYRQTPYKDLPGGCGRTAIDGVTVAGAVQ